MHDFHIWFPHLVPGATTTGTDIVPRPDPVPPWAFAPLLAAAVLWALVCLDAPVAPQPAWTAALVVWLSVAAIVEPVLANVTPLDFS